MASKDFYSTLGVQRGSSDDEIKKSYKKLAFKYHPDRNKDNKDAEARFKEISAAYEVLSDPEKRKTYDAVGLEGLQGMGGGGGNVQGGGATQEKTSNSIPLINFDNNFVIYY